MHVLLSALLLTLCPLAHAFTSFVVAEDSFMLDGSPIIIKSGSIHYHRTKNTTWSDRLRRLHAMGLNTVQTYVTWNFHSQERGVYNFEGDRDLVGFIKAVRDEGLLLNLRAGPYVCGETDFGGLPSYLLNTPGIDSGADLRTNNTAYMAAVAEWWGVLLPLVAPYTIAAGNGGPIAMVQMENEFGSYGNVKGNPADRDYMLQLRALALQYLPNATQLYTTDGNDAGYLNGGAVPGVIFATGDGGGPPYAADQFNPPGWRAHINSELYPGWLTHWFEGMANVSAMDTVGSISGALAVNGSFNLYMGFGGSNWGYFNGANGGGNSFQPVITSYDYDAPVSEGGGHGYGHDGDKYDAIRRIIGYWSKGDPAPPAEPPAPLTTAYPPVALTTSTTLFANLAALSPSPTSGLTLPLPRFEALNLSAGYMLFNVTLGAQSGNGPFTLQLGTVSDFATVYVNGVFCGSVWRPDAGKTTVALPTQALTQGGAVLSILVENCGHLNYGRGFYDPKGITGGVTINGKPVPAASTWTAYPLGLHSKDVDALTTFTAASPAPAAPAFFRGVLTLSAPPTDTYLTLCGWGKGQIYINGFHLGRYWGVGPQHTYYAPASLFTQGANTITVFETLGAPTNATLGFSTIPDFTGAVCGVSHTPAEPTMQRAPTSSSSASSKKGRGLAAPLRNTTTTASPAAATCSATPGTSTDLTLQLCDGTSTPLGASVWNWEVVSGEAGILSLASSPTLCVGQVGTNPTTGRPNLALTACDPSDKTQHWLSFPLNGNTLLNPITGSCMDAENGSAGAGARMETYSCDGGSNQAYTFKATNGGQQVVVGNGGGTLCVAACAP